MLCYQAIARLCFDHVSRVCRAEVRKLRACAVGMLSSLRSFALSMVAKSKRMQPTCRAWRDSRSQQRILYSMQEYVWK